MESKVTEYLQSLGFKLQPCSIPLNDKEYFKRFFYLSIRRGSLFSLINKLFPIKFKSERDDKSIWFVLRNDEGRTLIEIELKPKSDEHIRSMLKQLIREKKLKAILHG